MLLRLDRNFQQIAGGSTLGQNLLDGHPDGRGRGLAPPLVGRYAPGFPMIRNCRCWKRNWFRPAPAACGPLRRVPPGGQPGHGRSLAPAQLAEAAQQAAGQSGSWSSRAGKAAGSLIRFSLISYLTAGAWGVLPDPHRPRGIPAHARREHEFSRTTSPAPWSRSCDMTSARRNRRRTASGLAGCLDFCDDLEAHAQKMTGAAGW